MIESVRTYVQNAFEDYKIEVKDDGKTLEMIANNYDEKIRPHEEHELFKHICGRHGFKLITCSQYASNRTADYPERTYVFAK